MAAAAGFCSANAAHYGFVPAAAVFDCGHYRMLREIQQRIGLEFFGMDCGLDGLGNLVVFEANASMLVHDKNEEFPYKAPFVHRIKSAFNEMLRKFAVAAFSRTDRVASDPKGVIYSDVNLRAQAATCRPC